MIGRPWAMFALLLFVCPVLGVQRPSPLLRRMEGGVPGVKSDYSGSHRTRTVVSKALGKRVATQPGTATVRPAGAAAAFLPRSPTQRATVTMLPTGPPAAIGIAGTPPPLPHNIGTKELLPVSPTATMLRSKPDNGETTPGQSLVYVIDGTQSWVYKEANMSQSGKGDAQHDLEVGISAATKPAYSDTFGKPDVPHVPAETYPFLGSSRPDGIADTRGLDLSAELLDKQVPTTGAPVGTTPMVAAAPAPANNVAATGDEDSHRVSLLMLIGILATAVIVAVFVAYMFLARHRRHGTMDDANNQSSHFMPKRRSTIRTGTGGRRDSRRPSALLADGLLSPREARELRGAGASESFSPARDRSSNLQVPRVQGAAPRSPRSPRLSRASTASMVMDNADFAAGARPSNLRLSVPEIASGQGRRSSAFASIPSLERDDSKVLKIGSDSSNDSTPPATPPRSPRNKSPGPTPGQQSAAETERSSSGLGSSDSVNEQGAGKKKSPPEQHSIEAMDNTLWPAGATIVTEPAKAASSSSTGGTEPVSGATTAKRASYAEERKLRRSQLTKQDNGEVDSRSDFERSGESTSASASASDKSAYAAERRSRRQSKSFANSQSRRSVEFDDSVDVSAAETAPAAASETLPGNTSSRKSRSSISSSRKSAGRIMAMQNTKAQDGDDEEETMV